MTGIDPARLEALETDDWAQLLAIAKRHAVGQTHDDPAWTLLRTTPSARLVAGRGRVRAATLLAAPDVWEGLAEDLLVHAPDRPGLQALVRAPDVTDPERDPATAEAPPSSAIESRRRQRALLEERDRWRRRARGAEVRLAAVREELATHRARSLGRDEELARLRDELAEAEQRQQRSLARERRRRDGELASLRDELATARRQLEESRAAERRAVAGSGGSGGSGRAPSANATQLGGGSTPAGRSGPTAGRRRRDVAAADRLVPGRPSRLPADLRPGTTEAARTLLHRGRRVLVDGYNVTKQHQGELDLEQQRGWLVQQLGTLVARRGIDPVVVFDGQRADGVRPAAARRVQVRFTDEGITADDEIVFAVEATDEPVVVVTDDSELVARVSALGADVIGTRAFLGVMR